MPPRHLLRVLLYPLEKRQRFPCRMPYLLPRLPLPQPLSAPPLPSDPLNPPSEAPSQKEYLQSSSALRPARCLLRSPWHLLYFVLHPHLQGTLPPLSYRDLPPCSVLPPLRLSPVQTHPQSLQPLPEQVLSFQTLQALSPEVLSPLRSD